MDEACAPFRPLGASSAVVTEGFNLPCRYVIHTVGPIWIDGNQNEEQQLISCYRACLSAAWEKKCRTVAFPLISSGTYGYPKDRVLRLAVNVISEFLITHEMTVYLCVFDRTSYALSQKLFCDVQSFIDDTYVGDDFDFDHDCFLKRNVREPPMPYEAQQLCSCCESAPVTPDTSDVFTDLSRRIDEMDKGFAGTLFELIDKKGISDVECYKRANVSRKTFSKIKCDSKYRPSKETAVAFAIALHLDLTETEAFLRTAGISLSHSFRFDVIIEYCISNGIYDIFRINEILFRFDQPCLGC